MDRGSAAARTTSLSAAAVAFLARSGQTSLPALFQELDAAQQIPGLGAMVDGVLASGTAATLPAIDAHLVKPVEPPELLRALMRETAG